jgi:leucyl-tRNA synthetase
LLLSPLAPHVAEELWQSLGHTQSLMYEVWPAYDERLLSQATVQLPVQVNGRVRGVLAVPVGTTQDYAEQQARSLPNVAKYLSQGEVKKVIYVPDRSLNFVMVISNG